MTSIYERLESDHRELEELMGALVETEGASKEREESFEKFSKLLQAHSHAEERAFYSVVLAEEETREKTAHATKEHCEAAETLEKLQTMDPSHGSWLQAMRDLQKDVLHHISEEEEELFKRARAVLSDADAREIGSRFETLMAAEME